MSTVGSYDRPSAEKVISYHASTVLEDGLDSRDTVSKHGALVFAKARLPLVIYPFLGEDFLSSDHSRMLARELERSHLPKETRYLRVTCCAVVSLDSQYSHLTECPTTLLFTFHRIRTVYLDELREAVLVIHISPHRLMLIPQILIESGSMISKFPCLTNDKFRTWARL